MKTGIRQRLLRWAILLAFFSLAAALGGWWVTRPLAEAADRFVERVGSGRAQEAFAELASGHEYGSLDRFHDAMRQGGLDRAVSASWRSRGISGDTARVRGTATTRDGEKLAVAVELARDQGEWRILRVVLDGPPGAASPAPRPSVPASARPGGPVAPTP